MNESPVYKYTTNIVTFHSHDSVMDECEQFTGWCLEAWQHLSWILMLQCSVYTNQTTSEQDLVVKMTWELGCWLFAPCFQRFWKCVSKKQGPTYSRLKVSSLQSSSQVCPRSCSFFPCQTHPEGGQGLSESPYAKHRCISKWEKVVKHHYFNKVGEVATLIPCFPSLV